jgi:hypothetical protein
MLDLSLVSGRAFQWNATPFNSMWSLRMIKVNKEHVFSRFCVIWFYILVTIQLRLFQKDQECVHGSFISKPVTATVLMCLSGPYCGIS